MSTSGNIRAGSAYVEVTAQTSKLQRGLANAQAQLQNFGRSCTAVGKDMLMLSGALALPLAMAVKGFAAFDDQMRLVRAVTHATTAEFESMTAVASKLGRETSFTAKEVADGMVSLGRMGFSPAEIEQAIQATLDLARATGTELGESADIAANSLRIFGLEATQMTHVADVLTATANGSAQTLTDLFEALKMAGPQAKAAGESIEDTSAAIAVLANLGIKGSLAGTALRKAFSQFAKTKIQDQLGAIGIKTTDANGNLRKMADIIADIGKAMESMPSAERIAFAEDIFDVRGSLAGLSLGGNTAELDAFIKKLHDVDGVARTTAKEMDDGLGGSFRKLMSAVEGAMNAVAKAMEGTLKPLIDKATNVALALIKWVEANAKLVTSFAVVVVGAAAVGVALIAIGVAAKGLAAGITVAKTALTAFAVVQELCITKAAALKNSIMLIGTAFANYRNMAIPAMVGTEQLCAALGVVSSASNRAAAGVLMMSNAEAAAAAKSFLAAKWAAMANALKGLTTASIAATIATKAQGAAEAAMAAKNAIISGWNAMIKCLQGLSAATVMATASTVAHSTAEAVCTAGTVALNKARQLAVATTALFTAANLKAAVSISAVTVGNLLLAAAAKIAAVAMLGLSAIMSAVAAHPVAAALIALGIVLAGVVIYLANASTYTAKLSDEMSKLREKGDELRQTDEIRMKRLQQLSQKQKLTNAEMAEAKKLAGDLQNKYGDLGISVTSLAEKQKMLNDAQTKITQSSDPNKETQLAQIERLKQLAAQERLTAEEQTEAESIIESLNGAYNGLGLGIDAVTGKLNVATSAQEKLNQAMKEASLAQIDAEIAEMQANINELNRENDSLLDYWHHNLFSQVTGRQQEALNKIETNGGRIDAYGKKIIALKKRRKAISEGDQSAVSGAPDAEPTTKEKYEAEQQRQIQSEKELEDAEKRVAEIEKKLARERKTDLENEIDDIIAMRDEYKKLIQSMLDYELAKPKDKQDQKKVSELQGKLTQADKDAEERMDKAKGKSAEDAAKRVAEMEKAQSDAKKTDLQKEIDGIIAERDEYKKLIQTMLEYEQSKPKDKRNQKRISELQGKLTQADKTADDRVAEAKGKDADRLKRETADFQKNFDHAESDIQERRAESAQDSKIESTLETDKDAGVQMLQRLIAQYQLAAAQAKQQFDTELQAAQADGRIDEAERARLNEAQSAFQKAESMVDKYSAKLDEAQKGTQQVAERTSPVFGSFLAQALNDALGGSGNEAQRTATATEKMAKAANETNSLLKKIYKKDDNLTYA